MNADSEIGGETECRAQGVVELVVPELEGALAFYTKVGFAIERRTADFVAMQGYGCRLFLDRDAAARTPSVHGCNLRIVVDDVDVVYRRLANADIRVDHAPADRSYGMRVFSITDPNGFVLRFAQVLNV